MEEATLLNDDVFLMTAGKVVLPKPLDDSDDTQVCVAVFPEIVVTGIPGVIDITALERIVESPHKRQRTKGNKMHHAL